MRIAGVLSAIGVSVALGCTASEPEPRSESEAESEVAPAPPTEPLAPPVGAWVVIDERHGLLETGDPNGIQIRATPQAEPGPRLRVAEVVANRDGFVELRTISSPIAEACAGSLGFEEKYELHFSVELAALHPVLARRKRVEFDDGTKLELATGVPVLETGATGRVLVGKTQLVVNLVEGDVGRWWEAPDEPVEGETDMTTSEAEVTLHYGEHSFVAEWAPFLEHDAQKSIEDGRLLTYFDVCGTFVFRAGPKPKSGLYAMKGPKDALPRMARNFDPDVVAREAGITKEEQGHFLASPYGGAFAVGEGDEDVWGGLTGTEIAEAYGVGGLGLDCTPVTWNAPAETVLSWPSGSEAGRILVAHLLPSSAKEREGRVCFTVSDLEVCSETAKLERREIECPPRGLLAKPSPQPEKPGKVEMIVDKAKVSTGLDPDIVRRIIRAHINEVRTCLNSGLGKEPKLAGKVEIEFSIAASGKVASSKVHSTTLEPATDQVPECIAKAVKRWTFPKPFPSATVDVVYPFELSPG